MKVTYKDENVTANIEVIKSTIRTGLTRSKMISDSEPIEGEDDLIIYMRRFAFPSLIAASVKGTVKVKGKALPWPLTFDQFLELPEQLGDQWLDAVQELNPQWFDLPEIDEKKVNEPSTE